MCADVVISTCIVSELNQDISIDENQRVLKKSANIVLKRSAEIVKPYSDRTMIIIEYSLSPNLGPHLV